jgi:predicted dehydrogenase
MIRAAIIGLGTWGQHLVRNVQGISNTIQFTAFATRTPAKAAEFAAAHGLPADAVIPFSATEKIGLEEAREAIAWAIADG